MTFLGRRIAWLLAVALSVCVIGGVGWYLLSGQANEDFAAPLRGEPETERVARAKADADHRAREASPRARAGGDPRPSARARRAAGGAANPSPAQGPRDADPGSIASQVWRLGRFVLLGIALGAMLCVLARAVSRYRRRYRRYVVRIGRVDSAPPLQVARMMAAIWAVVAQRAHERLWRGQPAVNFEVHNIVAGHERRLLLMLVLPEGEEIVRAVEGAIKARWHETYLTPYIDEDERRTVPEPWWCERIVRLKKQHRFAPRTLHIPRSDEWRDSGALIDSVLATMQSLDCTATLQLTLWPAPRSFEGAARSLIREREETLERDRERGGSPGLQSKVAGEELEGGAEGLAFEALYFGELRVGAREPEVARRIADTVAGNSRSRGQNQLVERQIARLSPRRRIYEWRMRRGQANPLPSWWKNVFSAAEVAGLWQLPGLGAHSAALERHYQPRAGAPPAVETCDPGVALAQSADRRGVAISAGDLYLNHLILGVHGSGKTSLLLRQFERLAADYERAVVFADPKGDAAKRAVGLAPADRPVTYLSLRRPEVGIDLWDVPGASPDEVMDGMIWALTELTRGATGDAQVFASSERFLRFAGIMVQAAYAEPTFYHLWHLLSARQDATEERERIANEYGAHSHYATACKQLLEWNEQLRRAPSQQTIRMDAPANKVSQLTAPAIDKVLRHPCALDLDRIIANREILIVEGHRGFAAEMSRALQLLLLGRLHRALLAQLDRPEQERVRTHVLLDEAQNHFSRLLVEMAETDRAAGLELTAAAHHLGQLEDKRVRAGVLGLFRHRSVFQVGDEDARLLTDRLQVAWQDSLRGREEERDELRFTPTTLIHQPTWHFTAAWEARGAAQDAFAAETYRQREDPDQAVLHLEEQRRRLDAFELDDPPPPPPIGVARDVAALEDEELVRAAPQEPKAPEVSPAPRRTERVRTPGGRVATVTRARPTPTRRPAPRPPNGDGAEDAAGARAGELVEGAVRELDELGRDPRELVGELGSATKHRLSAYYRELARYSPKSIQSLQRPDDELPPRRELRLQRLDLQILQAVWKLRALSAPLIGDRFMPKVAERTRRSRLQRLVNAGLVKRCKITTRGSGSDPWIYLPTARGFAACQRSRDPETAIPSGATYRERELNQYAYVVHDLRVAAWVFAFCDLAGELIVPATIKGPLQSQIEVPHLYDREARRHRNIRPAEIPGLGPGERLVSEFSRDPGEWGTVKPDASVELRLPSGRRYDLLIEFEHRSKASTLEGKLANYDALLSATWRAIERYREAEVVPFVVFVCSTADRVVDLLRAADRVMTARERVVRQIDGRTEQRWGRPGRMRTFYCFELDLHQRTTRALRLNPHTAQERRKLARNAVERHSAALDMAEQRPFLKPELLRKRSR